MPTLRGRRRSSSIHSWSFVYLKSGGYAWICQLDLTISSANSRSGRSSLTPALLRSLVERHRRRRARLRGGRGCRRRTRSAGCARSAGRYAMPIAFFRNGVCVPLVTTPGLLAVEIHVVAVARDAAVDHLEADELPRRALGLLLAQHVGADERRPSSSRRSSRDPPRAPSSFRRCRCRTGAWPPRGAACRARRGRTGRRRPRWPASRIACQTRSADCGGTKISKPSSPV